MLDRDAQSHNDGNGRVGQSRRLGQSAWTAHWSDTRCKTAVRASVSYEEETNDISIFAKESRKENDIRTAKITDERLVASSQILRKEQNKPFPMFNFCENNERALASKTSQTSIFGIAFQTDPSKLEWVSPEAQTPPKNCDFQRLEKTVKFHNFFEKSGVAASRPSKDDFTGSTPKNFLFGVSSSAPLLSMRIGEEMNPSSYNLASKEHMGPDFSSTRQNGVVFGKQCKKPLDQMGIGQFSGEYSRPMLSRPEKLNQGCYSLPAVPCSVRDPAKFKGKMVYELLSLSQDSGFQTRQGVKLQLLGSSTDSEEQETSGKFKTSIFCLKNASSADTDTMEMNTVKENRLSGTTSCPSNKDVDVGHVSTLSRVDAVSAREGAGQRLLDINQRIPDLPAAARSTDDRDTSSSRTESLDVERLFSNPEQAADSTSYVWQDGLLGSDPSSRWIKRLKLTASDSLAHGTKSSHMPEASSHEKANKDEIKLDQTVVFLRNAEVYGESDGKVLDKPVAHSWIRRWCHNQATRTTQKGSEAEVTCEPESFKETSDRFQKKQFPSIAAMALMGKAMKRFRPCQFQNLGPSVVWNTERF